MEFTKKERLFLINQYEILKRLDTDNATRYDEYIEILSNGYEISYRMIDEWIYDGMPKEEGRFVLDLLSIYGFVEDYKRNNPEDTEISDHFWGNFKGFDGNDETEYMGFVRFLIHTQGKFSEQLQYQGSTDDYNSHMSTLTKYRQMVQKWEELGRKYQHPREAILEILNA